MKRQLRAILAADIVGYSRLMESDEAGTIARQKEIFSDIVEPAISENDGRIVKLMGDGVLIEFASVVDAVTCAVSVQTSIRQRERNISDDRRIAYRVGVNLGDVFHDNDDIFGDGVNIAARLEQMAEPGGICISGTVYDHLKFNIPVTYEALGDVKVKNIEQPIRAYRIHLDGNAPASGTPLAGHSVDFAKKAPVAIVAVIAVALAVIWVAYSRTQTDVAAPGLAGQDNSGADAADVVAGTADRPSIAVLPFDNLGASEDQEYFSDGMTEDLITDLSQVSGLFVIARNTTFTYKGRAVNVQQVGQELGVRYVLEGSVRRSGERLRINAQLIDAHTGGHIWAERYDREMTDVFALQDDVVNRIVKALSVTLNTDEKRRLSNAEKIDPEAYDALLRGLEKLRRFSLETNLEARSHFERAIKIDPRFARAYADIALTYALEAEQLWAQDPEPVRQRALEYGLKALELDSSLAQVHFVLSVVYRSLGRAEDSIAAAQRSVELEPNYADGLTTLAISLNFGGRPEEGLVALETAIKLNPLRPFFYVWAQGQSYYLMGEYDQAAALFEQVTQSNPHFPAAHKMLVATYVEQGRLSDAEWAAQELLTSAPGFSVVAEASVTPYTDPVVKARYLDSFRAAGIK